MHRRSGLQKQRPAGMTESVELDPPDGVRLSDELIELLLPNVIKLQSFTSGDGTGTSVVVCSAPPVTFRCIVGADLLRDSVLGRAPQW